MSFSFRNLFKKEGEENFEPRPLSGGRAEGASELASVDMSEARPSAEQRVPEGFGGAPMRPVPEQEMPPGMSKATSIPASRAVDIFGEEKVEATSASPFSAAEPPEEVVSDEASAAGGGDGLAPFGAMFSPPREAADAASFPPAAAAGSPFSPVEPEVGAPFTGEPFSAGPAGHEQVSEPIPGFAPLSREGGEETRESEEAAMAGGAEASSGGPLKEDEGTVDVAPPTAFSSAGKAEGVADHEAAPTPFEPAAFEAVPSEEVAMEPVKATPFASVDESLKSFSEPAAFEAPAPVEPEVDSEVESVISEFPGPIAPIAAAAELGAGLSVQGGEGGGMFSSLANSFGDAAEVSELPAALSGQEASAGAEGSAPKKVFGGGDEFGSQAMVGKSESPGDGGEDERMDLSLRAVLEGVPQDKLGFDAEQIPVTIVTAVPVRMIKPQLASGRVTLLLEVIRDGCDGAYQPAFAKADLSCPVHLPIEEVMENLPEATAKPGMEEEAPEPAMLETPFSQAAAEDAVVMAAAPIFVEKEAGGSEEDEEPAVEEEEEVVGSLPEREEIVIESPESEETLAVEESVESEEASGMEEPVTAEGGFMNPFGGLTASLIGDEEPQPLESLEAIESPILDEPDEVPAAASTDGLSSVELQKEMETDMTSMTAETFQPSTRPVLGDHVREGQRPAVMATSPASAPPGEALEPATDFVWGVDDESELLELRAALMTDEELTSQRVAELASRLPGIGACLILSATGDLLGGNFPANIDTTRFEHMAPRIYTNMRDLSAELGVGNAETFTVHTDEGMLSFFMGAERCLSVLHASRHVVPGVRERLTLIARELSKLNA